MSFIAENRRPIFIAVIFTTLFIFLILGVTNALSNDGGQFFAGHPTATPPAVPSFSPDPVPISFSDLDNDPFARQGQQIRVTGRFVPQTPVACIPHKGPQAHWGLIGDNLQMDGVGMSDLARLVPEGAELTVSGIWRLYEGPMGCGKEPSDGSLWYLEARRVHQPNPLLFDDFAFPTAFARVGEGAEAPAEPLVEETNTPTLTPTLELLEEETPTPTPTLEVTVTPTISGTTAVVITPTITSTPTPRVLVSPTPLDGNGNGGEPGNGNGGEPGGGNSGTATATSTPDPNDPGNPGGVPTSPPSTVAPATLPATVPPGGYDGRGGGSGNGY